MSGRGRERKKINTFLEIRCSFCFDYFVFPSATEIFLCSGAYIENLLQDTVQA